MVKMKFHSVVSLCLFTVVCCVEIENSGSNSRESRKLFGGYRITPKFCQPTRKGTTPSEGPNICMFNHECSQRNGELVGACMDGFLFGACCQLPAGTIGELVFSELNSVSNLDNKISATMSPVTMRPQTMSTLDITSSGVSKITQSLLDLGVLPTAQDNAVIQIGHDHTQFMGTGVTHSPQPETMLINQADNEIYPTHFRPTTRFPVEEDLKTTMRTEDTTLPYANRPIVHISVSNAPSVYTASPGFNRPMFKPKPSSKPSNGETYVLVPTISHEVKKPNKTQEYDSIVNILAMLNETSTKGTFYTEQSYGTSIRPPSTSYIFSVSPTRRPGYEPTKTTSSKKPPSTSYVFSTTVPPRRTETTSTTVTTTRRKTTATKKPITKPSKTTNKKPPRTTTKKPTKPTTLGVSGYSTVANSPTAFTTTKKPPSTSYVYTSTPTRRPPSTIETYIAGPAFSVTSSPGQFPSTNNPFSSYPTPAPTLIVLSPITEDDFPTREPEPPSYPQQTTYSEQPSYPPQPAYTKPPLSTYRPPRPTSSPNRKPINQVTINNHVTQNIYSTSERPSPTVLITPKPSISSTYKPFEDSDTIEVGTAADQFINFPPVRNPNLNMSNPVINDDDITTPAFIEDDALNEKMESFVNKIIQGLQEPFQGLRDVVYNRNKTANPNLISPTKKPVKKQGTTTKKPPSSNVRPTSTKTTTRKPPTKRPGSSSKPQRTTKKPSHTTKLTTTTTTTTTESFIEHVTEIIEESQDYRSQCGRRPLVRAGKIVGGKGAVFGEFPWQVLVRESTWLGLFTKNKCGGVLISNKYVMTAAHCQPGFLASLIAVFGEFDISGDLETKRSISRNVKKVIVHRQYDAATFENDLALLELEQPVQFDSHIVPICLPREDEDFTGRMATVTGWGRLKYQGGVPSVLQEVQVPIMENHVCQEMFRTGGHPKVILESFVCAGYANGQKDSCEGDSGGPLVLERPDGRFQLVGTVSHGIKCAAPFLPGVYMRTQYYKPWITSITGIN